MTGVTVSAVDSDFDFWGTTASDIQSGITVMGNTITGTLKKLESGQLVTDWGEGYFLGLAFTGIDERASQCLVGLEPSQGSGLVDIIPDPDKVGVFKITDKDTQKLVVISRDPSGTGTKQVFDLSELVESDS